MGRGRRLASSSSWARSASIVVIIQRANEVVVHVHKCVPEEIGHVLVRLGNIVQNGVPASLQGAGPTRLGRLLFHNGLTAQSPQCHDEHNMSLAHLKQSGYHPANVVPLLPRISYPAELDGESVDGSLKVDASRIDRRTLASLLKQLGQLCSQCVCSFDGKSHLRRHIRVSEIGKLGRHSRETQDLKA